ncbi:MAG: hypothetical protein GXP62_14035 [Oligoflexia bacterium]|nr:hypothetical protein [Oligoflexia bacterium]
MHSSSLPLVCRTFLGLTLLTALAGASAGISAGTSAGTSAGASADDTQTLLYDLNLDGQHVGTRQVTLTYQHDAAGREVRQIESFTELQATVLGQTYHFANRASARVGTVKTSFTSSVSENGQVREIQARQRNDGSWRVSVVEDGKLMQTDLPRGQADLCSLQLLDPIGHRELTTRTRASVLAAETGTIMSGLVEDLGEGTLSLGQDTVAVHRWSWTPKSGRVELAWSMDGLLVSTDSTLLGRPLRARLRAAPVARAYGEVQALTPVVGDVAEQEL